MLAVSTFNAVSGGLGIVLVIVGLMSWRSRVAARAATEESEPID